MDFPDPGFLDPGFPGSRISWIPDFLDRRRNMYNFETVPRAPVVLQQSIYMSIQISQISWIPDFPDPSPRFPRSHIFWIARIPDFPDPGFPGSWIFWMPDFPDLRFPEFQISQIPDPRSQIPMMMKMRMKRRTTNIAKSRDNCQVGIIRQVSDESTA